MGAKPYSLATLVKLKKLGVADLLGVEAFGATKNGHRKGEGGYTPEECDQIVANFRKFSAGPDPLVPVMVGLGHEDAQPWLEDTGLPAAGRVTGVEKKPGNVLAVDLRHIPRLVADAVDLGAYFKVSAVIDRPPEGVPAKGWMLLGLDLIGRKPVQLKWLKRLPALRRYCQSRRLPRGHRWRFKSERRAGGGRRFYAEAIMDRSATIRRLKKAGFRGKFLGLLEGLEDKDFRSVANAALSRRARQYTEEETPPDRAGQIAAIIEADPDENRADLEALEEAELLARWQGTAGDTDEDEEESEGDGGELPDELEDDEEEDEEEEEEEPAPPKKSKKKAAARAYAGVTPRQLRELARGLRRIERRQAKIEARGKRVYAETQNMASAARVQAVRGLRDELMPSGAFTPADFDEQAKLPPRKRKPNLFLTLVHASGTRRYAGTGLSEYDALVAQARRQAREHAQRYPDSARRFTEKLTAGGAGVAARQGDFSEDDNYAKEYAKRRNETMRANGATANGVR